jgi:hypothetical protein
MHIRIVKRPLGEAPEQIRNAWIGLVLPVVPSHPGVLEGRAFGVLSGPRSWVARRLAVLFGRGTRRRGYVVETTVAIGVLETAHPAAAEWWRTNAAHLLTPGRCLFFEEGCCAVED